MSTSMFTHWGRGANDPWLDLWIERGGKVVESVTVHLTTLPSRTDLLARMPDRMRSRMLAEAISVEQH